MTKTQSGVAAVLALCGVLAMAAPRAAVALNPDGTVKAIYPERPVPAADSISDEEMMASISVMGSQVQTQHAVTADHRLGSISTVQAVDPQGADVEVGSKAIAVPLTRKHSAAAVAPPAAEPLPKGVLSPDKQGVITVSPRRGGTSATVPNPFDVRFVAQSTLDEFAFEIAGTLWGEQPVSFINTHGYAANDHVQGFTVYRVRVDGCVLQRDDLYFFLPTGKAVKIRLPKQ